MDGDKHNNEGGRVIGQDEANGGEEYVPYIPDFKRAETGPSVSLDYLLSKSYLQSIPVAEKPKPPGKLSLYEQIKQQIEYDKRMLDEKAAKEREARRKAMDELGAINEHFGSDLERMVQSNGPPRVTEVLPQSGEIEAMSSAPPQQPREKSYSRNPMIRPKKEYSDCDKNGYPRMTKAYKRYKHRMFDMQAARERQERLAQEKHMDELSGINEAYDNRAPL